MTTTPTPGPVEVRQAERLFDAILGNVSAYGEWGTPSYREDALREINAAFARHRQSAERAFEERERKLQEALKEISELHGEINPCNYDHDDACELNRQFCYALTVADQALKETPMQNSITHEALEALRIVIEAAEPMRLKEQTDCLLGTKHRNPIQKAITKLEALRTSQLTHAVPSGDEVEAVARELAGHMEGGREYDQMPATRRELKIWSRNGMALINDATQEDAREAATAAIAALDAVRGKQACRKARENGDG